MSKKLTPKNAEKLSKKLFKKFKNKIDTKFYILHSKHVVETAMILASKRKVDKNILQIAGWLHDIGSIINRENHAKHSIEIIKKYDYEISEKLKDCILNHSGSADPKTTEGKIMQIADKASTLEPEMLKFIIDISKTRIEQEDIHFLKKTTSKSIELLEKYNTKGN